MSLDRTLKMSGGLVRARSVLTRAERIAMLTEEEKFDKDKDCPFGLPKVRVHHSRAGHKAKKEKVEGAEGAEAAPGAAAPVGAAGKAPAGKAPAGAASKAPAGGKAPAAKAEAKGKK
jgi:small basic protein (TIGR04137 family)